MAATPKSQIENEFDHAVEDILSAKEILEEAYTPESTRDALSEAIGRTLEVLEGYEPEDEDEESEEDSD